MHAGEDLPTGPGCLRSSASWRDRKLWWYYPYFFRCAEVKRTRRRKLRREETFMVVVRDFVTWVSWSLELHPKRTDMCFL